MILLHLELVCDTFLYEDITDVCFKEHHLVSRPVHVVFLSVVMTLVSEVWDICFWLLDFM